MDLSFLFSRDSAENPNNSGIQAPMPWLSTNPSFGGQLPTPLTQGGTPDKRNAPVYSSAGLGTSFSNPWVGMNGVINPSTIPEQTRNPGTMDPMLAATISAGHAGGTARGAAAFLGSGYNPWTREHGGAEGESSAPQGQDLNALYQTAADLGIDTSKYTGGLGGIDIRGNRVGDGTPNAMDLYNDLNQRTRDYYSIGGLSNGWAGGPANNASRTIYQDVGGRLLPVTRPQFHADTKDNGFIGREGITGLSMMLPAFGGWAGLLGSGTAGTLSAGSGLGLTSGLGSTIGTGLTNALVNSGMSALTQGTGVRGFLGGLGGSLLGAAGNSLMGNSGGLGSMFNTANAGSAPLNPQSYMNGVMNATGLSNSPLGMFQGLMGAAGGGGINANTLRTAGGGLLGNYLARRLDPRLGGIGSQVGRGLANMWSS